MNNFSQNQIHITKPFLKWVGGKTQIIHTLIADFPIEMNNYHEIFLGGGSVLLALLSYMKSGIITIHGTIHAYDINEPLIYTYKNIQSSPTDFYDTIQEMIGQYNSCLDGPLNRKPATIDEAKLCKENYYYWIRSQYNKLTALGKTTVLGSAMFVFLNKTCFRGVFRVGPNGFNVPYGHYDNPAIVSKEHLNEIHQLIQGVRFECSPFTTSIPTIIDSTDYVYLDPPYAPETKTSFVGYTENGFNIENHRELFGLIDGLTTKGIKCMLSNADVELVRYHFTSDYYNIISLVCKRSIHSKNPDAKAKEVVITNYDS
jgi:DNA adenine methylase